MRNKTKAFLREVKKRDNPILTGRVTEVDAIGRTAMVRYGGGASGVRVRIANQSVADVLKQKVDTGAQPTVTVRDDLIVDVDTGSAATPVSVVQVEVSGVDVTTLNEEFYDHIENDDAHHLTFDGLLDQADTAIAPTTGKIKVSGAAHVNVLVDSGELKVSLDPTDSAAITWAGTHQFDAQILASDLLPRATDAYMLGSSANKWQKAWVSELDAVIFAENVTSVVGGQLLLCKGQGTLGAAIGTGDTVLDFGQSMTVGDFVVFRAAGALEWVKITSSAGGTTYNVTRNEDGSGANAWPEASVYAIFGQSGDYRIEHDAINTPRISMIRQGTSASNSVEVYRLGDLNGNWGYATPTIGLAIGEYAASLPNITVDATNGLRIRSHSNNLLVFDTSGNAQLAGVFTFGANGGIYQGSGSFGSPTTGLKIYNSGGFGVLEGYNAGLLQVTVNSSGKFTFAAGNGTIDRAGIAMVQSAASSTERSYRFTNSGGTTLAGLYGYNQNTVLLRDVSDTLGSFLRIQNNNSFGATGAGWIDIIASNSSYDTTVTIDPAAGVQFGHSGGAASNKFNCVIPAQFGGTATFNGQMIFGTDRTWSGNLNKPSLSTLTLQNSWVLFGSPYHGTAGSTSLSYSKDVMGVVRLHGVIKSGTTTNGTIIGNLPAGYRPAFRTFFAVGQVTSGGVNSYARVDVAANGDVIIAGVTTSDAVSLYPVQFIAGL